MHVYCNFTNNVKFYTCMERIHHKMILNIKFLNNLYMNKLKVYFKYLN